MSKYAHHGGRYGTGRTAMDRNAPPDLERRLEAMVAAARRKQPVFAEARPSERMLAAAAVAEDSRW